MSIRRYGTTNGEYDCAWYGMVGPIRSGPVWEFARDEHVPVYQYIYRDLFMDGFKADAAGYYPIAPSPPLVLTSSSSSILLFPLFSALYPLTHNQQASLPGLPLHPRHRPPGGRAGAAWQEVAKVQGIGRQLLDRELYQPSAHGRRPRWAERYIFRRDRACRYGG